MNNTNYVPPWWEYPVAIGYIICGIFLLKLWTKSIDPKATPWERAITERNYLIGGMGLIIGGVVIIIISIYKTYAVRVGK